MSSLQYEWILGFGVGIVIVILAITKLFNRDGALRTKYDERQALARGKAYMYATYSMMFCCILLMIMDMNNGIISRLGYMCYFIPVVIGIIAQVSYSIFSDAYIGQNTNMTKYIIFMAIVSVLNISFGCMALINGKMLENGKLTGSFANLCVGILFIIVAAELILKKIIDGREERD